HPPDQQHRRAVAAAGADSDPDRERQRVGGNDHRRVARVRAGARFPLFEDARGSSCAWSYERSVCAYARAIARSGRSVARGFVGASRRARGIGAAVARSWRETILNAMRVPPTPAPPPGSPPRIFRAAPNFFKLRLIRFGLTQLLAVFGLFWAIWFASMIAQSGAPQSVVWVIRVIEIFGIAAVAFRFAFGWMLVYLDFELRWYM